MPLRQWCIPQRLIAFSHACTSGFEHDYALEYSHCHINIHACHFRLTNVHLHACLVTLCVTMVPSSSWIPAEVRLYRCTSTPVKKKTRTFFGHGYPSLLPCCGGNQSMATYISRPQSGTSSCWVKMLYSHPLCRTYSQSIPCFIGYMVDDWQTGISCTQHSQVAGLT